MNSNIKLILCSAAVYLLIIISIQAQNTIMPREGYTPLIGATVEMLEDLKRRVTSSVQWLSVEETDFLLDDDANRIGALILHLAATERFYQVFTFENRSFNEMEREKWIMAQTLGEEARESIAGKPIKYYLDIWDDVRKETLRLLKSKDDEWFAAEVSGADMNNHWAWYHVMEHQANHMGQIRLIMKRI